MLTTYIDNEVIKFFRNMKKGKFHVKATIDIVGIVIYEGNVVDSKMHGKGSLIWSNGDSYSGQWQAGMQTAARIYTWADNLLMKVILLIMKWTGKGRLAGLPETVMTVVLLRG